MAASIDFTIAFEEPDERGWIVARMLEEYAHRLRLSAASRRVDRRL